MCPTCLSKELRVSRKRWTDFLALLIRAKPVRCLHCDNRSYSWPWMRHLTGGRLVRR
jgi:hypothetical protein